MKIAIVATTDIAEDVPWHDPEWQIWTCTSIRDLPRYNVYFDVPRTFTTALGKQGEFPYQQILADFGTFWFNSAPSWLVPFALMTGALEIGLFVDNLDPAQQLGMLHWMWTCEQLRVKIFIPPDSELLKPKTIYGLTHVG